MSRGELDTGGIVVKELISVCTVIYASVCRNVLNRFAGICPGADAFPAVPKVTQEPTS